MPGVLAQIIDNVVVIVNILPKSIKILGGPGTSDLHHRDRFEETSEFTNQVLYHPASFQFVSDILPLIYMRSNKQTSIKKIQFN